MLRRADVIIPLAAIVGAPACDKKPEESQAINVEQLRWIVGGLNNNQLLLFPNSNSGIGTFDGVADENAPRNSVSLYGRQKDEAEDIVRTHPNHIVYRLATVFGLSYRTRTDLLVNTLVQDAIFSHNDIKVFDPDFRRNFIHVDDITYAFSFAINHRNVMKNQVYNLGNDSLNTTKLALAQKVGELTKRNVIIGDGNDADRRNYEVSSAKLMGLGWKPYRDLTFGIKELMNFYSNLPEGLEARKQVLAYTRNV